MNKFKNTHLLYVFGILVAVLGWWWIFFGDIFLNFFSAIPAASYHGRSSVQGEFLGGDHTQVAYLAWKLKIAILNQGGQIFTDHFNFVQEGKTFFAMDLGFQYWLIAFFSILLGDTAGYNFGFHIFPSFLAAIGMYFLLCQLTVDKSLRVLGAVIFAIAPYRLSMGFNGHGAGSILFLIPYYFGFLILSLKNAKPWGALGAGIVLFLLTASEEHSAYYLLLFTPFVLLGWVMLGHFSSGLELEKKSLKKFAFGFYESFLKMLKVYWPLAIGAFFAMFYGKIFDYFVFGGGHGVADRVQREFSEIAAYSRALKKFFDFDKPTLSYSMGWFFIMGLVAFVVSFFRKFRSINLRQNPGYLFIFIFPWVLAMMVGVGNDWSQQSGIYEFFYRHLPYFKYQRVPDKIWTIAFVLLLILNVTMSEVIPFLKKGRVLLLFFGISIFEFGYVSRKAMMGLVLDSMDLYAQDLQQIRNATSDGDILLVLPAADRMYREATLNQFLAMKTGRRFVGGYHGAPPVWFEKSWSLYLDFNTGQPKPWIVEEVIKQGVTKLLVYRVYDVESKIEKALNKKLNPDFCAEKFCLYTLKNRSFEPKGENPWG
jgi:hypothetical protein